MRRLAGVAGLGAVVAGLAACNETGPAFRRVEVRIVPEAVTLDAVGATETLAADVTDSRGDPVFGVRVSWASSDAAVAEVDDEGLVVARSRGVATITASVTGLGILALDATARVEVAPRVATLDIVGGDAQTGAAGTPLPEPIAVSARDRLDQPVAGVDLVFVATRGDGSVTPSTGATDAEGRVDAVWTLGPAAGAPQRLRIGAPSGVEVDAEAEAVAGAPASVAIVAGDDPYAVRESARLVEVEVADAFGNGVPDAPVAFVAASGSGTADPSAAITGPDGAASTTWRTGASPGVQRLDVDAGSAAARLEITVTPPPATVVVLAGDGSSAPVATAVPVPPTVRVDDADGAPVPGVPVTFTVTAGGGGLGAGGDLVAVTVSTDADGGAAPEAWVLGTGAGPANQTLQAAVEGLPPRVFTATATPGPPATLVALAGDGQTGGVTTRLPVSPTVQVEDAWANPVPGAAVTFRPEGGFAAPGATTTDAGGRASTDWTLGPVAGTWTLRAAVDGPVQPVVFTATATGSVPTCALDASADGFDLQICAVGAIDATAAAALESAAARWEALVTGDLADVPPPVEHTTCAPGAPWVAGPVVDDLVVYATVESIDGPGGALAGAAPCFVREDGGLPLFARLRLDADDVADLDAAGRLIDVVVHELAHALGFGTLWPASGHLRDPSVGASGPVDTHFDGPAAVAAFDAAGGATRTIGPKVPVQRTGGGGVADVHWRESVMGAELLTPFPDGGEPLPLSAVTVASLADLGYTVDVNLADPFVVPFPNLPVVDPDAPPGERDSPFVDDLWWGPFGVVDADGTLLVHSRTERRSP